MFKFKVFFLFKVTMSVLVVQKQNSRIATHSSDAKLEKKPSNSKLCFFLVYKKKVS